MKNKYTNHESFNEQTTKIVKLVNLIINMDM